MLWFGLYWIGSVEIQTQIEYEFRFLSQLEVGSADNGKQACGTVSMDTSTK